MERSDSLKNMARYEEFPACEPQMPEPTTGRDKESDRIPFRSKVSLLLLVVINFLNYMDRYTISTPFVNIPGFYAFVESEYIRANSGGSCIYFHKKPSIYSYGNPPLMPRTAIIFRFDQSRRIGLGVLTLIQNYFDISNTLAGLLQTVFTCSYMIFAPIFGYMGDRFPRKYVMAVGIVIWSVMTYVGSLMNKDQFWYFFAIRALVGIGEASYSTVALTIIADLFVKDQRTKALSLFYFAIPCGSGLGFIAGSKVAAWMGHNWRWALRVTPGFGVLCALLSLVVIHEPERGAIEVVDHQAARTVSRMSKEPRATNYIEDLKYLFRVKSFVWATIGTTCIAFVSGSVAFWAPKFFTNAQKVNGDKGVKIEQVSFKFGIITVVAGITGVFGGAEISKRFRRIHENAEALVCAYGILAGAPIFFFSLFTSDKNIMVTWILVFCAETLFCLYWVPNADLRLAVIIPTRRSTAEAVQMLTAHLLGDASSPFIIGAISDGLSKTTAASKQDALLTALYITPFFCVLGGGAFLFCSLTLSADKNREQELVIDGEPPT